MKYFLLISFSIFSFCFAQVKSNLIKIVADDRAEYACFGWSTNIFGNYCVVGTSQKSVKALVGYKTLTEVGGAYIFAKQKNGNWQQTQLLLPNKPKIFDSFGTSVSMYERNLAIGCNGDDSNDLKLDDIESSGNRMGAVYMYKLDKFGKWNKTQKIILDNRSSSDNFGKKVFLYKNKLAISSPFRTFKGSIITGAVYIYEQSHTGTWVQKHEIKCPEKDGYFFGEDVSLSDSLLVINLKLPERVYVYRLSNNNWELISKLNATNLSDAQFGSSVFVRNNLIFVGANGGYENNSSVFANNLDTIAFRKINLLGSGSVYIYSVNKNDCSFKQRIVAKDIKADMHFGMCLSASDSLLVVGAFGDALDVENLRDNRYAGAVYVFKQSKTGDWSETKKIVSPQRSIWDKFGFSVSVFNQTLIIGSRFEKENANEKFPLESAGAAYIYEDK